MGTSFVEPYIDRSMNHKAPPREHPIHPIVVVGGFLAGARLYKRLGLALEWASKQPVVLVPIQGPEWIGAVSRLG